VDSWLHDSAKQLLFLNVPEESIAVMLVQHALLTKEDFLELGVVPSIPEVFGAPGLHGLSADHFSNL
jgi:hypothetical protein